MRNLLQVVIAGLIAVSFSAIAADGDRGAKAGPTDNPNVTRDAQGREHVNKGKHTGQMNKGAKAGASGSGSTSGATEAAPAPTPAPAASGAPKKVD